MIETNPVCAFINLGRRVSHSEKMDPIDFGGQRSNVDVIIDMYGNKLVNTTDQPISASSSTFADMLIMVRE